MDALYDDARLEDTLFIADASTTPALKQAGFFHAHLVRAICLRQCL